MQFEVTDLDHLAFRVRDLEASLEFYHDLLGLSVRDRELFDAGELPFVALAAGGRHLHLFPSDDDIDVGNDHLCLLLRCNDTETAAAMDQLLDEVARAGYEVLAGEPEERLGAYGRDWAAYVRDPDGRIVELKLH